MKNSNKGVSPNRHLATAPNNSLLSEFRENLNGWSIFILCVWILATVALGGVADGYAKIHLGIVSIGSLGILVRAWNQRDYIKEEYSYKHLYGVMLSFGVSLAWMICQQVELSSWLLKILSYFAYTNTFGLLESLDISIQEKKFSLSADPQATYLAFQNALAFFLMLFCCVQAFKKPKTRMYVAYGIVWIGAIIAFFGMVHRFSGSTKMFWFLERGWTFFGPYVNANHAGTLLATTGAMGLGIFLHRFSKADQWLWAGLIGLIFLGLVFTGSRSAVVAVSACFGIFLFFHRQQWKQFRYSILAILSIVLILAVAWQAASLSRIVSTVDHWMEGKELRFQFWWTAIKLWWEAPFVGIGYGAFSKLSAVFFAQHAWVHPEHVENDYLEWLVCGGMIGVTICILPMLWLGQRILYILKTKEIYPATMSFALGLMAFGISSLFVFNAPLPSHQLLFAILLGGLMASHQKSLFLTKGARPLLLFFSLTGLIIGSHRMMATTQKDLEIEIPDSIEMGNSLTNQETALVLVQTRYDEASEILRRNPMNAKALYALSSTLVQLGQGNKAVDAAKRAISIAPYDLRERVFLTKSFGRFGMESQALLMVDSLLSSLIPWSPQKKAELHLDAAFYAYAMDDLSEFDRHLNAAKKLVSNDWRIFQMMTLVDQDPNESMIQSWRYFQPKITASYVWDFSLLAKLRKRKDPINLQRAINEVGRLRPDVGNFLHRYHLFYNKSNAAFKVRLDLHNHDLISFIPGNEGSAHNATWFGRELNIKVIRAQPMLDVYFLPVDIWLSVPALSFQMLVQTEKKLTQQLVLKINGKFYLTHEMARKVSDNTWELTFRNVGQWFQENTSLSSMAKVSGIGFSPLERDGRYTIKSIEVFVDSLR